MKRYSTLAAILLCTTFAACTGGDAVGDGAGDGAGDGGGGDVGDGDGGGDGGGDGAVTIVPASRYALATDLTVPAEALLPQPGYDAAQTLRELRANAGQTILGLLADAGVPLIDDLPSALKSRLAGWITSAINSRVDLSVIDPMLAALDTVIADVDVDGELVLDGDAAVHRVLALRFDVAGESVTVSAASIDPVATVEAPVVVTVAAGTISLGEHAFGIPFGEYAWQAVEAATMTRTGGSVRDALGAAVDCAAVADAVASTGYLGVYVGHEAQLLGLCNTGLDLAWAELHAAFTAYNWDALRLGNGAATLVDADADGLAEALAAGTWGLAQIDVGTGARAVGGTFVGTMQ